MGNSKSISRLDSRAVDRIFTRLLVRYGAPWLRLWDGLDIGIVKEDWARELAGMSFEAIIYALDNLPSEKPPATANAFKQLANNRPHYFQGLPPPKTDPEMIKSILDRIKIQASSGSQEWARHLQRREQSGERLSFSQKQAWRQALRVHR